MGNRKETPDIMDQLLTKSKKIDSKTVNTQDSKTAIKQAENDKKGLIKATFYLFPEDVLLLENVRLKRIAKGFKPGEVHKSILIREAIKLLSKQ